MDYLDIPRPMKMTERSPSQTNFVIEEDGGSEYGDTIGENPNDNENSQPDSSWASLHFWARGLICSLSALCLSLVLALSVVVILYARTFPSFEICRTKNCAQTAMLFVKSMDDTVSPCEDFHRFACGNWISDMATVVSVPIFDHTTIMRERMLGRLRRVTENISMSDIPALHQLKYFYQSCIDLESIEKAGLKPLVNYIKEMIRPNLSVAHNLGRIRRLSGQNYLIDLSVTVDNMNTSYNAIFLDQPDLPSDSATSDDIVETYDFLIQSVATILTKEFGQEFPIYQQLIDNAKFITDFELQLSNAMTDETLLAKPSLYNVMTVRELNRLFSGGDMFGNGDGKDLNLTATVPHFNWTEYLEVVFEGFMEITENTTVIVNDMAYVTSLASFLNVTARTDFDLYLTWQLLYTMGKDVTSEVRSLFNRFTGDGAASNRRTACISLLDHQLPFLLTHKYVLKYVDHRVIDEAEEMAENIIKSFKIMISELDWMDQNTKSRAMEKADQVRKFLGYPAWLTNPAAVQQYHKGLKFTNSFFHNMATLMKWVSRRELNIVRQPVDLSWPSVTDSPAEADAFYVDELNAITFPAGFLQQPFIGMGIRAADYGALGAVIGHELTHGFDTTGRYSDAYGRLSSWWSVDTLTQFLEKAECFIEQYGDYRLPELESQLGDNDTVNGQRTLSENIADNGGIREALRAYRAYVAEIGVVEGRLTGLEKYTPEQIFFLSYAQSWCSYMNPTSLADMVQNNVHSPSRFRIIGPLSNFDEFSKIWNCPRGSKMNPHKKCVLW